MYVYHPYIFPFFLSSLFLSSNHLSALRDSRLICITWATSHTLLLSRHFINLSISHSCLAQILEHTTYHVKWTIPTSVSRVLILIYQIYSACTGSVQQLPPDGSAMYPVGMAL